MGVILPFLFSGFLSRSSIILQYISSALSRKFSSIRSACCSPDERILSLIISPLPSLMASVTKQPPSRLRCCAVIMERRRRRSASGAIIFSALLRTEKGRLLSTVSAASAPRLLTRRPVSSSITSPLSISSARQSEYSKYPKPSSHCCVKS